MGACPVLRTRINRDRKKQLSTRHSVIGITTYPRNELGQFYIHGAYVDSVRSAGGVPVLLPAGETNAEDVLTTVDGLIFAGGGDIDPSCYRGQHHGSIERVNAERDDFEISLAKLAFHSNKPVLGICRGMQLLNVASGGDLIQHIPDIIPSGIRHRGEDRKPAEHPVRIEGVSRLSEIIDQKEIQVQSSHHQGLKTIPPVWKVTARSPDELVEAIERIDHPWMIAVLWHPELSPDDNRHKKLFRALVEAGRQKKENRKH